MLANERTLAAWWRTVMTALAAAVGLARLFGDAGPEWLVRGGASLLVLLAVVMLFVAVRRYQTTAARIESECVERVPRVELWIGSLLLVIVAAIVTAVVWMPH